MVCISCGSIAYYINLHSYQEALLLLNTTDTVIKRKKVILVCREVLKIEKHREVLKLCMSPLLEYSSLYVFSVVSTSRKNVNIALVLAFLYKLVDVFEDYFKDVEEESIRDNFVVIYELLDEMMDFGYPQTTEGKILQE